MNMFTRPVIAAITSVVAVATLTACTGGGGGAGGATGGVVEGATFTLSMANDPGALDPQASTASNMLQLAAFAYDRLIGLDNDGDLVPWLAEDWAIEGATVTLTLKDGITCSDGSEFTAETAAENLNWVADPANLSPFFGVLIPPSTSTADADTLTIHLDKPAPFVLQSLAMLPMVCAAGLEDRSLLTAATAGSGPYVLTEAAPNDHYTFQLNPDYAWGPSGATTKGRGMPATIVARVIPNETTSANLVLSGEVNAAQVIGPDAKRLEGAGLFSVGVDTLTGEQWYNQKSGHATSDPAVRMALTQALDLAELQKIVTSGEGTPATALAVTSPAGCGYNSVSGNVPETDVAAAENALDDAGWVRGSDGIREKDGQRLSLSFLYMNILGTGGTSAAELAVQACKKIGVEVTATSNDATTLMGAFTGTGDWDIAWLSLNVWNPDQLVPFFSGPVSPDGNNWSSIHNADYESGVAEAMTMTGADGCDTWKDAEAALFRAADLVPFANTEAKTFGNGAKFAIVGWIVATSIQMLAK